MEAGGNGAVGGEGGEKGPGRDRLPPFLVSRAAVYDVIIEDGTVVSASGRRVADVAIEGGIITYVGPRPAGGARRRISAAGRYVLPGFIDTHVHFRDPGHPHKEDWESGSRAAVIGGTTTVCDMPNTSPPTITVAAWEDKAAGAAARSRANYGIWFGGAAGHVDDARRMADEGAACGIKVFMGASTGPLLVDDATLGEIFARTDALLGVHAESEAVLELQRAAWSGRTPPTHHDARPAEAAVEAVRRLIELCRARPRPVHVCHVSTAAELAELEAVRGHLPITLEVSPHHLWLDNTMPLGNLGKVNPPLRPPADRVALWQALNSGVLDTIGSDHAPHTLAEKGLPYEQAPAGLPGVEMVFSLLAGAVREGRLSVERMVSLCAEAPARLFGFTSKGRVAEGADADLLIYAPSDLLALSAAQVLSRVGWSPFVGVQAHPFPDDVLVGGRVVAGGGRMVDDGARGTLVRPVGRG